MSELEVGDWVERRHAPDGVRFGRISRLLGGGMFQMTGGIGKQYVEAVRNLRRAPTPVPLPEWTRP